MYRILKNSPRAHANYPSRLFINNCLPLHSRTILIPARGTALAIVYIVYYSRLVVALDDVRGVGLSFRKWEARKTVEYQRGDKEE